MVIGEALQVDIGGAHLGWFTITTMDDVPTSLSKASKDPDTLKKGGDLLIGAGLTTFSANGSLRFQLRSMSHPLAHRG